jgi:alpha,alpha-trehalase
MKEGAETVKKLVLVGILCACLCANSAAFAQLQTQVPQPPSIEFGQLFRDVQLQGIFPDSKTFCDLVPNEAPSTIVAAYDASKGKPGFTLAAFVAKHFRMASGGPVVLPARPGEPVQTYIAELWNVLEQQAINVPPYSSLLPLPHPYVVPGGRFTEVYYWDSYFTMLGLEVDGRDDLARNMVNNFAFEIDRYGHVPNGNRTYYLSRSQPPFFADMVDLIAERDGARTYLTYLPELEKEYAYWMAGADALGRGQAYRNVVRLRDGTILNRYLDERDGPRDESYREDIMTALGSNRPPSEVYRDLRAAAESGWDFSSRWLADGRTLSTIQTLSVIPVDLNSLMEHLELTLATAYRIKGDALRQRYFEFRAADRTAAIRRLMWDAQQGLFTDYLWQTGTQTHRASAASLYPLFFRIATAEQAQAVAGNVATRLLMPNGVATTLVETGQQWDQPNGWAPLQWIAVAGLNNYGQRALAQIIAQRWMHVNFTVYSMSGKLVEKYDLLTASGGTGGEYALQIGFGWTNGVLRKLMTLYAPLAVRRCCDRAASRGSSG